MSNPYQAQIDELTSQIEETKELAKDPEMAELAASELHRLEEQLALLNQAVAQFESSGDSSSSETGQKINCTIEIRGGAGGDEAKIWANDLLRMYIRFIESTKLKFSMIDDLVIKVTGKTTLSDDQVYSAYELLQYESGVHRVQRVPATESSGRIHTSTASVAVLPEISAKEVEIRDEDLEWQFMRASGAGGQSVNKTSSAVRLIHTPTGITVTSRQEKKQEQNRKIALDLLRSQLWEIEEEKRLKEIGDARSAIGRAKRAEKIRTYNFPQNRITDHRTKQSWHNLPVALDGGIEELLLEFRAEFEKEEENPKS